MAPPSLLPHVHCLPCRDRVALCQLWRAIILRDDTKMKAHAAMLGVQGEVVVGCWADG